MEDERAGRRGAHGQARRVARADQVHLWAARIVDSVAQDGGRRRGQCLPGGAGLLVDLHSDLVAADAAGRVADLGRDRDLLDVVGEGLEEVPPGPDRHPVARRVVSAEDVEQVGEGVRVAPDTPLPPRHSCVDCTSRHTVDLCEGGNVDVTTLRLFVDVARRGSFAQLNLVPLLPELAARYQALAFALVLTDAALDLVEERIDVAVRLGPLADSGLIAQRLAPMVARVCATPAYLARRGRPAAPADLAEHDCLLLAMPGFTDRWRFRDQDGRVADVRVRGQLRTSNAVALKACALGGMGVISQARWIVGRELRDGRLVDLFPEHEVVAAGSESPAMWLLYPTRVPAAQGARVRGPPQAPLRGGTTLGRGRMSAPTRARGSAC